MTAPPSSRRRDARRAGPLAGLAGAQAGAAVTLAVDPTTMTALMRRVGAERHRLRPHAVARVRVHPRAHALLEKLAEALYERELAAVVDVPVVPDPQCELSEVRCETF